MKKILLPGGSGYLGRILARALIAEGFAVVTLARKAFTPLPGERFVAWDGKSLGAWAAELEGAEAVINLAGRTVNCRYSRRNREEMMRSRVDSTLAIGQAIQACRVKPKAWLNSSTATIYRHALDRAQDEASGEIGKGFSVEIAKAWESALFSFSPTGVRLVALRSAMVFGPGEDGVYGAYRAIARQGLGGRAATGEQFVSWVHSEDFVGMILWILRHPEIDGAVNIASPEPLPNKEFMRELRAALGLRFGLPAPEWLLELGAIVKRTETELLLKSRRVVPTKLLASGYAMKFPSVRLALENLSR